ncbi:hypothetical protein OG223_11735 [Streptomyces sp. NBC_01478]|jgi:hypothetical protein|uniref:hypothetical protein n=1 Tax=Streptomyces sp. NBC_01478 TaxID=2903882 RepID=UPI002E371A30|nr:hypothetical protein [Streptomyces sp. NBC_01478]
MEAARRPPTNSGESLARLVHQGGIRTVLAYQVVVQAAQLLYRLREAVHIAQQQSYVQAHLKDHGVRGCAVGA